MRSPVWGSPDLESSSAFADSHLGGGRTPTEARRAVGLCLHLGLAALRALPESPRFVPAGGNSHVPDLQKRRAEHGEVRSLVQNSQDLQMVGWGSEIQPAEFQGRALSVSPRSFQMGFRVPQAWSSGCYRPQHSGGCRPPYPGQFRVPLTFSTALQ